MDCQADEKSHEANCQAPDPIQRAVDCIRERPDLAVAAGVVGGVLVGVALSGLFDATPRTRGSNDLASSIGRRFMATFDELGRAGADFQEKVLG